MKNTFTFLIALFISLPMIATAQSPEIMSYQAVIRDGNGTLISNQQVGIQISILQGAANGTPIYIETQNPTTNTNGLASFEIGAGQTSDDFSAINWAAGPYFVKTEVDPTGNNSNYTITTTNQLMSVPYSLHSKSAEKITGYGTTPGEMLYWDGTEWEIVTRPANYVAATLTMSNDGTPFWVNGTPPLPNNLDIVVSTTGKIWLDRNLGASQVATSSTDALAYGDLYQWGRASDGHQIRTSDTTNTIATANDPGHNKFIVGNNWRSANITSLWQGVNGINNPCPTGFRIPTETEWTQEMNSWNTKDAQAAFENPLKLTLAGYRSYGSGNLANVGTQGTYASSTPQSTTARSILSFENNAASINTNWGRGSGSSVRCIKD